MNDANTMKIKTVLGTKNIKKHTAILSHEHICCYSDSLYTMSEHYLDKTALIETAVRVLKRMKERYGLGLLIDCTTPNIGRDTELLKEIALQSGVEIVCSTGFYYTDDPILHCTSAESLANFMIEDAERVCAGIIKIAVEHPELSEWNRKILKAAAMVQKKTKLPIVLHTNANNRNGKEAVERLLGEGVAPNRITVGHLSDTNDMEYVTYFAKIGCFVAFDRIYDNASESYVQSKVQQITRLYESGYENQILLSHDDAVFQGFEAQPKIREPRWNYLFERIVPNLGEMRSKKILYDNPLCMLSGTQIGANHYGI